MAADDHLTVATFAVVFQHTAARRRLLFLFLNLRFFDMCFNTQPPEGGCNRLSLFPSPDCKFQHTAARRRLHVLKINKLVNSLFQHTAARRRLLNRPNQLFQNCVFQHTAARRRLPAEVLKVFEDGAVSTHSRPKAAARPLIAAINRLQFQHTAARRRLQDNRHLVAYFRKFQHTAARRRLQMA